MRRLRAALALALGGCTYFYVNSDGLVIIGFVWDDGGGVVVIEAPDTVRAGVAFGAVVNTSGSSSCTTPVRTDVVVDGLVARITPYDRVAEEGTDCTADVAPRPHPVEITFPKAGAGTLEVRARTRNASGTPVDTVVRRPITIR